MLVLVSCKYSMSIIFLLFLHTVDFINVFNISDSPNCSSDVMNRFLDVDDDAPHYFSVSKVMIYLNSWLCFLVLIIYLGFFALFSNADNIDYEFFFHLAMAMQDLSRKTRCHSIDFSWSGSSWICKKRRNHHTSFCRNGITISVSRYLALAKFFFYP